MRSPPPDPSRPLEDKTFLVLLVAVSVAFAWILVPFYGAVFWGIVLAIVFAPLQRRLPARLRGRPNLAALTTLAIIVLLVVLPLAFIGTALMQEGAALYRRLQSGEISVARSFEQVHSVLPGWLAGLLDRFGLSDMSDLQRKLTARAAQGSQAIATHLFDIGQNTLDFFVSLFVALYLAFFLLRDGATIARRLRDAIPLDAASKRDLFAKFATVIRATVKGNVVVAAIQGALGGLAFWALGIHGAVLWGTLMAFLSLLPAVGAALIWLPVALWLLATGAVWKGIALILWGTLVIGVVDNVLRPILVGKDIKRPDYLVLVSTLGGMAIFGLDGFVIGPVVAALFLSVWDIFTSARRASKA